MDEKRITRRDFLTIVGGFLLGSSLLRFKKVFALLSPGKKNALKEARYYTTNNDLAG